MNTSSLIGIALAVTVLNCAITLAVARNGSLAKQHKVVQFCLIWLLPGAGALMAALFLRSIRDVPPDTSSRHVPNSEDYPGVNLHPPVGDP